MPKGKPRGCPRKEQITISGGERAVTVEQFCKEHDCTVAAARRWMGQAEHPLPFMTIGGIRFIRDGAARKFWLHKERSDTERNQEKFKAREALQNQRRFDLLSEQIDREQAQIHDGLNE